MNSRTLPSSVAWLTGTVAVLAIIGGLAWGGAVVWRLSDELRSMPSTEVPGELSVEMDQAGERVVYYERQSTVAVPVEPDIVVSVTGPEGTSVSTEPTTRVQYRWFRTVRQAHATFAASEPGTYTVAVVGDPAEYERAVAVGPRLTASSTMAGLVGPAVVLLGGVLAAAGLAFERRRRRNAQPAPRG